MVIHPSGPPPLPADPCSIYIGQTTFYDGAAQSCFLSRAQDTLLMATRCAETTSLLPNPHHFHPS